VLVRPAVSFLFKLPITFPFQRKERKEINVMGRKRKGQPENPNNENEGTNQLMADQRLEMNGHRFVH